MSSSIPVLRYQEPVKAAIITSQCGGSMVAALAVERAVRERFPGSQCSQIVIDDLWPGAAIQAYDRYLTLAEGCYFRVIKFLTYIEKLVANLYLNHFSCGIEKKVFKNQERPDILISTTPFINAAIIMIAKKRNIPIFIFCADMDARFYAEGWPKDQTGMPPHRFGIYYSIYETASTVPTHIPRDRLVYTGGFIKPEFTQTYSAEEKEVFRRELRLPEDRKIVSLMMGSLGGAQIFDYADRLLNAAVSDEFAEPAHFVVFCAKNERLRRRIEALAARRGFTRNEEDLFVSGSHSRVSFSILGFTDQVHKYYALSSGLITKPGAGSVNEAIAQNLPLLLDNTQGQFPWEELNGHVVELYGLGSTLYHVHHLPERINTQFLDDPGNHAIRENHARFKADRPHQFAFSRVIGETIEKLLLEEKRVSAPSVDIDWQTELKRLFGRIIAAIITLYNLIAERMIQCAFFSEFLLAKSALLFKRKQELLARPDVTAIEGVFSYETRKAIDALYLRAPEERRTGNVVFYFLAKPYQQMHPRNFEQLLRDGADIVLFNPTSPDSKTMTEDAKALIRTIRQERPTCTILFHSYCIGAHSALRAAKDLEEEDVRLAIPMILDRGFESSYALARKVTFFSAWVKHLFHSRYDVEKARQLRGRVCFIGAPQGGDQLLHDRRGRVNFLLALRESQRAREDHQYIELPADSDHFTRWNADIHNRVKRFMSQEGILKEDYQRVSEEDFRNEAPRSFVRRVVMPFFL